ncbi:MAG: dihydrodipicolinate reductase C-terminal domain-containing protein [Rhodocyclaceae bacterium]|nr:dihydrodipicolinate reductase C-terminal domain-containing protein [Rhodocyclaceae bacterium]
MIRVGLVGYGKAGKAVADVLVQDERFELCWIARRSNKPTATEIPVTRLDKTTFSDWLAQHPVDAVVDFSDSEAVLEYGEALRKHKLMLVSAISCYPPSTLSYMQTLGEDIRVMNSPNITLGINFLMLAARLLRRIAPFADVGIVEQHFRDKSEVSGTAKRIAETLSVDEDEITSLRLGGIIGHHEVIFGFPHQTVRLIHDSIRREAFGTGAAFALTLLATRSTGFYTYEELLLDMLRRELQNDGEVSAAYA